MAIAVSIAKEWLWMPTVKNLTPRVIAIFQHSSAMRSGLFFMAPAVGDPQVTNTIVSAPFLKLVVGSPSFRKPQPPESASHIAFVPPRLISSSMCFATVARTFLLSLSSLPVSGNRIISWL